MAGSATRRFARMTASAIKETASLLQERGMSSDPEFIAQFVLGKSATSFEAVRHLCRDGFGPDALMIARTIFENAINLAYINKRPAERAALFLEFEHVEEYRQMESLKKALPSERVVSAEDENRIGAEYRKVRNNYKGASWSGESMQSMALECGLGLQYALIYRIASGFVHGGPRSAHTYIERQAGHCDVRLGAPGEEFTDGALLSAGLSVLLALEEVCRAYGAEPPDVIRTARSMAEGIGGGIGSHGWAEMESDTTRDADSAGNRPRSGE